MPDNGENAYREVPVAKFWDTLDDDRFVAGAEVKGLVGHGIDYDIDTHRV